MVETAYIFFELGANVRVFSAIMFVFLLDMEKETSWFSFVRPSRRPGILGCHIISCVPLSVCSSVVFSVSSFTSTISYVASLYWMRMSVLSGDHKSPSGFSLSFIGVPISSSSVFFRFSVFLLFMIAMICRFGESEKVSVSDAIFCIFGVDGKSRVPCISVAIPDLISRFFSHGLYPSFVSESVTVPGFKLGTACGVVPFSFSFTCTCARFGNVSMRSTPTCGVSICSVWGLYPIA